MSFSLATLLAVYVLGGLTFLPLVALLVLAAAYYAFPEALREPSEPSLRREREDDVFKTDDEKLVRRLANSVDVAAGYFLVTREWVPSGVNGKPPERASPAGGSATPPPSSQNNTPSVYQSMYRSLFDRKSNIGVPDVAGNPKPRGKRPPNEFFVVLRHGYLMLYDDEQQLEVRHVVSLSLYTVSIYGGGEVIPEGELYIRRNALCLTRRPDSVKATLDENAALPFYMFSENCSNKEDFYLALVKHQEKSPDDPAIPPRPLRYRQKDVISLVQRLHSSEDQLQMNWVNGLLGRVFLSIYRTPDVEQFFRSKIVKKISRVAKPNFLSDIKVQHIYVGDSIPYITNPRLKEMTADGDFCCEFDVTYTGNFRLEIATKATMNLGARFKPREVNLLLAVLLKRLEGHGVIRIKPPPSNRLWFSFERMPKMELAIEPIVGSRQVAWGPILRIIESRIREVIEESVVLPYYDDIPFTDTIDQRFRGGIWHTHKKSPPPASTEAAKELAGIDDGTELEVETDGQQPPLIHLESASEPLLPASAHIAASTSASSDEARAALAVDSDDSLRPSRTPSVKSKNSSSERKKTVRALSFSSMTPAPPAPSIGTDPINVTAVRDRSDPAADAKTASSALSRASASPQSPSPISLGHPGRLKHIQPRAESYGDDDAVSQESGGGGGAGGSSMEGFGNNYNAANNFPMLGSRTSTNSSNKGPLDTIAALGTATATIKKWYTTRKNPSAATTPTSSSAEEATPISTSTTSSSSRSLLPPIVPPPPTKKSTPPIAVPTKRRNLPPPLLPSRRKISAPPLPPRIDSADELLVVAAPGGSEPTTPKTDEHERQFDELFGSSESSREQESEPWRAGEEREVWNLAEVAGQSRSRSRSKWGVSEEET